MRSGILIKLAPLVAAGLIGAMTTSLALADPAPPPQVLVVVDKALPAQGLLTDAIVVSVGGYIMSTNVKASLNGQTTHNSVDFGQTFGTGGDYTRTRVDGLWRITPKHRIRFLYFNNSVTRSRTIDNSIDWGDYTFLADGSVQAHSAFKAYALAYEYAFMIRPDYEIAASAGVHYMDMSFKLSGQATYTDANGVVTPAQFSNSTSNLPAPLPLIGLRGGWAITPISISMPRRKSSRSVTKATAATGPTCAWVRHGCSAVISALLRPTTVFTSTRM